MNKKKKGKNRKPNRTRKVLASIFEWTFRSVMGVLTLAVCGLLVMAAYSDYVDPTRWVLPSFLGIAFGPILVAGLVWALMLTVLRRWHCLAAMGLTLLLICMPAFRICPLHLMGGPVPLTHNATGEPLEGVDSLRVFSFNTNLMGQSHLSQIGEKIKVIDLVRQSEADVVCLQEYGFTLKKGGHTELELRDELKDLYPYYDFTPNDGRKALGIALFSKYPIRKGTRVDKRKSDYFSAMYYQLEVKGRRIGIVNMHMRSNLIKMKDRALYEEMVDHFEADSLERIRTGMMRSLANAYCRRGEDIKMMCSFLQEVHPDGMPLLVCGDMNDTPVSYCHRRLRGLGLQDSWQQTGNGPGHTYRQHYMWVRIDHIFHNEGLHALRMRVRRDVLLSDHYPLEATFQLTGN